MGGQAEGNQVAEGLQPTPQPTPVGSARLNEARQPPQLHPADRRLEIERFEVVAQVGIDVFMVVALGQFPQAPAIALATGVIPATGAPAIAAPIAQAFADPPQPLVAHHVHGAALPHGEVVGWIEALGAEIAPGAGIARHPIGSFIEAGTVVAKAQRFGHRSGHRIAAAEGIAVVFDQPEVVLTAKGEHRAQVKRITQGMGHHHGLGLAALVGRLQLVHPQVARPWIGVHEHRHAAVLQDRRHRGGEAGRAGDHLIPWTQPPLRIDQRAGERAQGNQICRGAGIDQQAGAHPQKRCQFLLKGLPFRPQSEPEIEAAGHRRRHLILAKHTPGIGDRSAAVGSTVRVVTRTKGTMGGAGIAAGQGQDLCLEGSQLGRRELLGSILEKGPSRLVPAQPIVGDHLRDLLT